MDSIYMTEQRLQEEHSHSFGKVLTFKFDSPLCVVLCSFYYSSSGLMGSFVPSIACMTQRWEAKVTNWWESHLNVAVQRW